MTRQQTHSRGGKAAAALVGMAIMTVSLNLAAAPLNHLAGAGAWGLLGMLGCLVPAAMHSLQAFALDYGRSLECPVQMLVSSWPLLAVLAAAV